MKYIEVIDSTVFEILKKNNINISDFEITNDGYFDIRNFIKEFTSFQIKEEPMYQHQSKTEDNNIIINSCNNEDIKRFLITCEFAKTLLQTKKFDCKTNYELLTVNQFLVNIMAKNFVENLLIPDKLLDKIIKQIILEEHFENKIITDSIKRIITRKLSEKLVLPVGLLINKVEHYEF